MRRRTTICLLYCCLLAFFSCEQELIEPNTEFYRADFFVEGEFYDAERPAWQPFRIDLGSGGLKGRPAWMITWQSNVYFFDDGPSLVTGAYANVGCCPAYRVFAMEFRSRDHFLSERVSREEVLDYFYPGRRFSAGRRIDAVNFIVGYPIDSPNLAKVATSATLQEPEGMLEVTGISEYSYTFIDREFTGYRITAIFEGKVAYYDTYERQFYTSALRNGQVAFFVRVGES